MAEAVDTISAVETKTLPTGTTIYVIKDSQGREFTTREGEIAQMAHAAIPTKGIVQIDYTEKKGGQFGQFTNRFINNLSLLPDNSDGPAAQTLFANDDQPIPTLAGPDPFMDTEPPPTIGRDRDAEKELSINKAVALKAAVELMEWFEPDQRTAINVTGAAEYFLAWLQDYRP